MINKIILFSIKNKLVIGLFTVALIFAGVWSALNIPLDAVPDITNNQVQIITQAPNQGTEDIERVVTQEIEFAMGNLPGVEEIRSISRFGLSVVTIVFEDDMGTYLPRQLVEEKLGTIKSNIPDGFGEPELGPISTGLGEVYQYTLSVDDQYRDSFSLMDLRTLQDKIVARQMAMVQGVVEVNAFGGSTKQYEISVEPKHLKSLNLTIIDVLKAIEANNQNTGGAYIEKDHLANYIRVRGLIESIDDIRSIVIKDDGGIPVTINDVANVQFGAAIKYGAFTVDGEGEAVGGMVLMLKGANSNKVIQSIHERMTEIQNSLPEGVTIEPFLDRSKLITKTTSTVSENLIIGALIVIFVLVFLLGNWRGGIIVASTIPLSLLFAFILMNVFGVWANLMSLGAIDFGIIIDGAVIIVEGTVYLISKRILNKGENVQEVKDDVSNKAASKMMNSAFFGQLIILIVFIPILALQGVEGKMFRPMGLTFMFAMIGVMVLCLTYVPMMSSLFLKFKKNDKKSIGDKIVKGVEKIYEPLLKISLKRGVTILSVAMLLLLGSGYIFSKMGGEFIPELDEGDIAFHAILKPGSSLSETVNTTTKIEQILKNEFPEIIHVMSRIGVADVPTDPMPMDIADCFIILKPRNEWVSASSKEELMMKFKEAVSVVPGVNFEFTQPIEMRFNELLTGVREDLAVKLFGEDPKILQDKANEIGAIISNIDGVADFKVEATSGLPQLDVELKRSNLNRYKISVEEVNNVISTAFAGGIAGEVYEGEKRFDIVVRQNQASRKSIDDLKALSIKLPNGAQVPLSELANIEYKTGPMQISRDNTNKRTYVGINVRGRDVKSLVTEIQEKLDAQLTLPPGYYIRYGGAFENLERATERLKIVVPIALISIFILIFFALKSMKQTIMIYMVIPLAVIGGIASLWLRGMPFSISAGVGFIVLFGVAVLNGLVLISSWNELKEEGMTNINDRIILGTKRRIRPILLTALTDILGFLPMAISSSSGAEVQRPLATVVIGGMLSATLLTLFILPILYKWFETREVKKLQLNSKIIGLLLIGTMVIPSFGFSQQQNEITTVQEAISIGLANNHLVRSAQLKVSKQELGKKAAIDFKKTDVGFEYGQINSYRLDNAISIDQSFAFPTVYTKQKRLAIQKTNQEKIKLNATKLDIKSEIKSLWFDLMILKEKERLLEQEDSIYTEFSRIAKVKYATKSSNYLTSVTAESRLLFLKNQKDLLSGEITILINQLNVILNDTIQHRFNPVFERKMDLVVSIDTNSIKNNPQLQYYLNEIEISATNKDITVAKMLPDFSVGYSNQSMIGSDLSSGNIASGKDRFSIVKVGISVPLLFGSGKAKIQQAKIDQEIASNQAEYIEKSMIGLGKEKFIRIKQLEKSLIYFETIGLKQSQLIIDNAQKSLKNEAISNAQYLQSILQGIEMKTSYLETLQLHNQEVILLEKILGL